MLTEQAGESNPSSKPNSVICTDCDGNGKLTIRQILIKIKIV